LEDTTVRELELCFTLTKTCDVICRWEGDEAHAYLIIMGARQ